MFENPSSHKMGSPTPMVRPLDDNQRPSLFHGHGPWLLCGVVLNLIISSFDRCIFFQIHLLQFEYSSSFLPHLIFFSFIVHLVWTHLRYCCFEHSFDISNNFFFASMIRISTSVAITLVIGIIFFCILTHPVRILAPKLCL